MTIINSCTNVSKETIGNKFSFVRHTVEMKYNTDF